MQHAGLTPNVNGMQQPNVPMMPAKPMLTRLSVMLEQNVSGISIQTNVLTINAQTMPPILLVELMPNVYGMQQLSVPLILVHSLQTQLSVELMQNASGTERVALKTPVSPKPMQMLAMLKPSVSGMPQRQTSAPPIHVTTMLIRLLAMLLTLASGTRPINVRLIDVQHLL
jgi:hypothetical protein